MRQRIRKADPSSSGKAGLPSSLFELRRDKMPRLKMRKWEFFDCGIWIIEAVDIDRFIVSGIYYDIYQN